MAILSEPFMPFTSNKLKNLLNIDNCSWNDAGKQIIKNNHQVNPPVHLFHKIEDEKITEQLNKLKL